MMPDSNPERLYIYKLYKREPSEPHTPIDESLARDVITNQPPQ